MHLLAFDYFRGIAILFIVAGHSYGPWAIDTFGERMLANLITGGTALFVFISGFFFHYVFYERFHFTTFLLKKAKNVLLPYLILSTLGIFCHAWSSVPFPFARELHLTQIDSWGSYLELAAIYLWTGRIWTAYWYIPFIFIVFVLSPVFIGYIRLTTTQQVGLFLLLLLGSMIIQRPAGNLSPLHSVAYFFPVYLLGIMCSIHHEVVLERIKGKSISLGLLVVAFVVLQALVNEGYGNVHKVEVFSFEGIDVVLLQKIALCFFILSVFLRLQDANVRLLKLLASSSFAVFFIHPWVLAFFNLTGLRNFLSEHTSGFGVFVVTVPLVVVVSLSIAYATRVLLKSNSRYVIGW